MLRSCLCLLMILLTACPIAVAEDGDAELAYAIGYFKNQRWKYAAEALNEFMTQYPDHSRMHMAKLYYGLALNSADQFQPAREALRSFVAGNPENPNVADARFHVGECSYNLEEYQSAVRDFSEYLTKHPQHNLRPWALLMLGESHNGLGEWNEAERTLNALLKTNLDTRLVPDTTFALAVALQGQNRTDDAIRTFGEVIKLKSSTLSHRAYARIGTIYFRQREYRKASETYDIIVRDFSDKPMAATASLQSGIALFQIRDYEGALQRVQAVPQSASVNMHALMWTGLCYRELHQYDKAREALAAAFEAAADTSLAAEVHYNRAQVEVLDGKTDLAAQMFEDLADRWPSDRLVPDSLINAAQLQLEAGRTQESRTLIDRLKTDFPQQAGEDRVTVLDGRLMLAEDKSDDAIRRLREAASAADLSEQERLFRTYHLIRALHRGRQFQETVDTYATIREQLSNPEYADFTAAAALAAMSSLELKNYAQAQQFADDYLQSSPDPKKTADALAARAVASGYLKDFQKAQQDVERLVQEFPENSQTWAALLQTAEAAWAQDAYQEAATMFAHALNPDVVSPRVYESAASGTAWCEYRLAKFAQAANLFADLQSRFPDSAAAHEYRYMAALSLFEDDRPDEAVIGFRQTFEALRLEEDRDETQQKYLLDSGRMLAQISSQQDDIDQADQVWSRLADLFDESPQLPEILDAWAYLNLQHGRYAQSDDIYRRLLDRFPKSRFAGQARLSLAESEMQANRLDTALQEFLAIVEEPAYQDAEKEAALYHVIDIYAAQRNWAEVVRYADQFASQFSASPHASHVQLLHAEALLDQKEYDKARSILNTLRTALADGSLKPDPWTERLWIVLAEVALAQKEYDEVDRVAADFTSQVPDSRFTFQMNDVLGRRWMSQANPDFAKAREFFEKVTSDEVGAATETAARCQFFTAETYVYEKDYSSARKAYYRVYLRYPFDEWRVRGLYQAAECEVALNDAQAAIRSYEDLLRDFPESEWAAQATRKLADLKKAG